MDQGRQLGHGLSRRLHGGLHSLARRTLYGIHGHFFNQLNTECRINRRTFGTALRTTQRIIDRHLRIRRFDPNILHELLRFVRIYKITDSLDDLHATLFRLINLVRMIR